MPGIPFSYLKQRGFSVMLLGFSISGLSLVVYVLNQHSEPIIRTLTFAGTIAGFAIYVTGRTLVVLEKRKNRQATPVETIIKEPE
jgi:hypothetical protein